MKKYLKFFIIIALLLFNGSIMIYAEDTQIEAIEVTDIQIKGMDVKRPFKKSEIKKILEE